MIRSITLLLLYTLLFSYTAGAQSINIPYTKVLFKETFEDNEHKWQVINSKDNLFLVQDDAYVLQRKNEQTPFLIYNSSMLEPEVSSITILFELDKKSDKKSYSGLAFLVQDDNKGAFLLEIAPGRLYRIKQLIGTTYQLLSGETENDGWVKESYINGTGDENEIKINIQKNKADVYINKHFVTSLTDPKYTPGKVGIIVGPSTTVRINAIGVNTPKANY